MLTACALGWKVSVLGSSSFVCVCVSALARTSMRCVGLTGTLLVTFTACRKPTACGRATVWVNVRYIGRKSAGPKEGSAYLGACLQHFACGQYVDSCYTTEGSTPEKMQENPGTFVR